MPSTVLSIQDQNYWWRHKSKSPFVHKQYSPFTRWN